MDILRLFASGIKDQVKDINGDNNLETGVSNGINAAFIIIGVVAVIVIIVGGVSYMTSQGDPSKVTKGKKTMITGIVGLLVALLAFAIVNFVLNALQQTA